MTIEQIRQLQTAHKDLDRTLQAMAENFTSGANNIDAMIDVQCEQIELEQSLCKAISQFNATCYQPRYDFSRVV